MNTWTCIPGVRISLVNKRVCWQVRPSGSNHNANSAKTMPKLKDTVLEFTDVLMKTGQGRTHCVFPSINMFCMFINIYWSDPCFIPSDYYLFCRGPSTLYCWFHLLIGVFSNAILKYFFLPHVKYSCHKILCYGIRNKQLHWVLFK